MSFWRKGTNCFTSVVANAREPTLSGESLTHSNHLCWVPFAAFGRIRGNEAARTASWTQRDELAPFHCDDPQAKGPCGVLQVTAVHRSKSGPPMSALGHRRTLACACAMFALPPKADIG
jgi:hypothetical protein